jgi:metal-responsive CopG/Arc/MetJ family transcriptional regulator
MPPTKSERMGTITVSLSPRQIQELDEICERTRIKRSVLMREVVDEVIARYKKLPGGGNIQERSLQTE